MTDPTVSRRRILTSLAGAGVAGIAGCSSLPGTGGSDIDTLHVSVDGSDGDPGTEDAPLASIASAAERAGPGQTVYVHPGEYTEFVAFHEDGEPDAPITLTGPPDAVLKPPTENNDPAVGVGGDHIHITGLTISGLYNPDEPENPASYASSQLITLNPFAETGEDYLEGLVISPHRLGNAGQSLINTVQIKDSEIGGFKVIGPVGTDWILDDTEGHNGEIVYLGTAPGNRIKRGYDTYDQTRNIRVHHIDNSEGHPHSELVDCKTGTRDVTIEYCTDAGGSQEHEGGKQNSIRLDGHRCTVRWCRIEESEGPPIRIGPTALMRETSSTGNVAEPESELEREMGTEHAIYGNAFLNYGDGTRGAIDYFRERRSPGRDSNPTPADQRVVCGNVFETETLGTPGKDCPTEIPTTDGIGHFAGESPWDGTPPTLEEMREHIASLEIEATIRSQTITAGEPLTVTVVVRNTGGTTGATKLVLSAEEIDFPIADADVEVPPGERKRVELTTNPIPTAGKRTLTLNGEPIGEVTIEEQEN